MKRNSWLGIVLLFISINSGAKTIESKSVKTVLDYIDNTNTLIVFDIDNTLACTEKEVGSDEWFCYLVDQKIAQGYDKISAVNAALPLCYYAQFNVPLIPTESIIAALMQNLINKNICVMGLTSRSLYLAERTNEQLQNININFNMPCTDNKEFIIEMPYPCLYKYNTIFAGNNDKGDVLLRLLDTINYQPESIIFIDDKMYHIESVEKAALKRNITYIGIRYAGCDKRFNPFNPEKAEQQLQQLKEKNDLSTKKSMPRTYTALWNSSLHTFIGMLT